LLKNWTASSNVIGDGISSENDVRPIQSIADWMELMSKEEKKKVYPFNILSKDNKYSSKGMFSKRISRFIGFLHFNSKMAFDKQEVKTELEQKVLVLMLTVKSNNDEKVFLGI
jgi:hypothetical protein